MILVTGGTGHLGAHLLYQLVQKNKPVRAIFRNQSQLENTRKIFALYESDPEGLLRKIEWIPGDVTDYFSVLEALQDISVVYHAAGVVSFNNRDIKRLEEVNSKGTANIVNGCLEMGVIRLCHVSTIATLGETASQMIKTEDLIWNQGDAASAYAKSKFRGEMEVWRGIHEGLNAVIVNPSVIIGPGMWMGPGKNILESVSKGFKFYPPGSSGYIDVRDVAQMMILLTEGETKAERFILNSENISHKTIMDLIAEQMNTRKPFIQVTHGLARMALWIENMRAFYMGTCPRISLDTLEIAFENLAYSNEKIKKLTGVEFISIADSIALTVKLYREQRI